MQRHRFVLLLSVILVLLVVLPWLREFGTGARVVYMTATLLLIAGSVYSVSVGRRHRLTGIVLAVVAGALQVARVFVASDDLWSLDVLAGFLLEIYVVVGILRYVYASTRVTIDTIAAALCVYLLLGLIWAYLYAAVDVRFGNAFTVPMRVGDKDSFTAVYFSYVTLTTLGYGDISPVKPVAEMLSVVEAIVGQIYLTVLVARLVGLQIAHSTRRDRDA